MTPTPARRRDDLRPQPLARSPIAFYRYGLGVRLSDRSREAVALMHARRVPDQSARWAAGLAITCPQAIPQRLAMERCLHHADFRLIAFILTIGIVRDTSRVF